MRIEQLVQNNKLIETKQIVTGKQCKDSALFGALCLCFKTVQYQIKHHLYAALLGLFVWTPENDCVGKVVQSQNSTVAHKNPINSEMVVVESKLKIPEWKPEVQQTDMTSVYEICQKS